MHKATFNKNNTLSNIDFLCHNVSPPLKTTLALKSIAGDKVYKGQSHCNKYQNFSKFQLTDSEL
jgi:hypothetical protein